MMSTFKCVFGGCFFGFIGFVGCFLDEVAFCVENESQSTPSREQVARLVESAWKPPVTSIDATAYVSVSRPSIPREELDKNVRYAYTVVAEKSGGKESSEEFERAVSREVERLIKEQQSPAIIKKRIRWNGTQYREDKVSVEGNIKVVDSKTEFNRVIVNAGNPLLKDYTSFEYDLDQKIASIDDKVGSTWREDSVWDAQSIQPVSLLLKSLTMLPPKAGETNFVPTISIEKVSVLQEDKNEHIFVRTRSDKYKSYTVDRFEIVARQYPDCPLMVFYCDAKDYSKLYRSESFDPASGTLLLVVERDNFDRSGFPKVWITEEYTSGTSQVRRAEHVLETVSVDVKLPADIFEFNPPSNFSTVDNRPASPLILEPHEREFGKYDDVLQERQKFTVWRFALMGIGILLILYVIIKTVIKNRK